MPNDIGLIVEPNVYYIEFVQAALHSQGYNCDLPMHYSASTRSLLDTIRRIDQPGLEGRFHSPELDFDLDDVSIVVADFWSPVKWHSVKNNISDINMDYQRLHLNTDEERQLYHNQRLMQAIKLSIESLADAVELLPSSVRVVVYTAQFSKLQDDPNTKWLAYEMATYLENRIPRYIEVSKDFNHSSAGGLLQLKKALVKPGPNLVIEYM